MPALSKEVGYSLKYSLKPVNLYNYNKLPMINFVINITCVDKSNKNRITNEKY